VSKRVSAAGASSESAAAAEAGRQPAAGAAGESAGRGLEVVRVEVWENDTSCAAYEP